MISAAVSTKVMNKVVKDVTKNFIEKFKLPRPIVLISNRKNGTTITVNLDQPLDGLSVRQHRNCIKLVWFDENYVVQRKNIAVDLERMVQPQLNWSLRENVVHIELTEKKSS